MSRVWWFLGALLVFLLVVGIIDFVQWRSGIRRIFPIVGHLRFLLIKAGPELRQYIVAGNREERPFNRLERDWIYHSADRKNNYFGFGTDDQIYAIGYRIIKHSVFGHPDAATRGNRPDQVAMIPSAKVIGETRGRARPYHPPSVVNVYAMSFGSLGAHAVEAINRGAKLAHCFHNTGEGGVSPHHRHGADLCWQIGTGYFGARTEDGRFDLERLVATVNG
jgi:glutamate synthase domain-containing protein 2